ncbi:MAG TPA: STAS domain-containing protein [Candidatus Acidoferrales bacterium]|nr:STAS domain-containing protein [Candidatus Acidoferrales bacterium]
MAIEITTRQVAGVTIVDVSGRMVAGSDGQKLAAALMDTFNKGHQWLLLNCADLAFVDSSGLGDLVAAHASIVRRGGVTRLLGPGQTLIHLLARTRLDGLFDVYEDEQEAVASFTDANNKRTQQKMAGYLQRDV